MAKVRKLKYNKQILLHVTCYILSYICCVRVHVLFFQFCRLVNAKSIHIAITFYQPIANNSLLNRLSMLTNVEKITGIINTSENNTLIIETILKSCQNKLKSYDVHVHVEYDINARTMPAYIWLELTNAKFIKIYDSYFYLKWSNVCQSLQLCDFTDIDEAWCNEVIKYVC